MDEATQVINFLLGALKNKDAQIAQLQAQIAALKQPPTPPPAS